MGMGMNMNASIEGDSKGRVRGRLAVGLGVLWAVVFTALLAGPAGAFAATPQTPYEPTRVKDSEPKEGGQWGERMAAAEDLNGDSVKDLVIATPQKERVYLVSGKDRSVLRKIVSPEPQSSALFGTFVSVLGDVDGDGKDDVAVGAHAQDLGGVTNAGKAWVFSGATGASLYALEDPEREASSQFAARLGRAGDLTGDGISEVLVGASDKDRPTPGCGSASPPPPDCRKDQGRAYIFDGAAPAQGGGPAAGRTPIRTLDLPVEDRTPKPEGSTGCDNLCGRFGLAVQSPGDTDGDGVADQLVSAPYAKSSKGRMYVFDGANRPQYQDAAGNPKPRLKIDPPPTTEEKGGVLFGFQDVAPLSPGDVNGDNSADIYGNGFDQDGPTGAAEGRGWVFNGKTGTLLYSVSDPTPEEGGQFGWSMSKTDHNGDGTPDLYVGQSPHHIPDLGSGRGNGGTYVFNGKTGTLLERLEMPASDRQVGSGFGPNLGWAQAAPGDLNGDGEPDYVAAAPFFDASSPARVNEGLVYVFLSGCPAGTSEGVTCKALRPGGRRQITGTSGNDTIVGTDNDDIIDAGGGDDVVVAQGGNDAVNAGAGNDYVSGGEGNDRISGSTGNDYLVGASGDDLVAGNEGADRIRGDEGNDVLVGNEDNDFITGEAGNDYISGGIGDDRLSGGSGADRIRGDEGNDFITGDDGNDFLTGEAGDDRLYGGPGSDRLDGGTGRNVVSQ